MQFWAGDGVVVAGENTKSEGVNATSKLSKSSTKRRRGYRERQKVDEKKTERKKYMKIVCVVVYKNHDKLWICLCVFFS